MSIAMISVPIARTLGQIDRKWRSGRQRYRRTVSVSMILFVAAVAGAPATSLAGTRVKPFPLTAPGGESPSLVIEPNGTAILVWQTHVLLSANSARGSVWTAELGPRARRWPPASLVYQPHANLRPNSASVTVDSDGTTIALWTMRDERYGSLWVSVRPPGKLRFPSPTRLIHGGPSHDVQSPQAIVDGSGQLNVIWYDGASPRRPYLQTRPIGSKHWTGPVPFYDTVGTVGVDSISPVTTPDGESFVISGSAGDYVALPHPRGRSWGSPESIWRFQAGLTPFSPKIQ